MRGVWVVKSSNIHPLLWAALNTNPNTFGVGIKTINKMTREIFHSYQNSPITIRAVFPEDGVLRREKFSIQDATIKPCFRANDNIRLLIMKNCQKFGSLVFQTLKVNIEYGNFLHSGMFFCLFVKFTTRGGVWSLTGRFRRRRSKWLFVTNRLVRI